MVVIVGESPMLFEVQQCGMITAALIDGRSVGTIRNGLIRVVIVFSWRPNRDGDTPKGTERPDYLSGCRYAGLSGCRYAGFDMMCRVMGSCRRSCRSVTPSDGLEQRLDMPLDRVPTSVPFWDIGRRAR